MDFFLDLTEFFIYSYGMNCETELGKSQLGLSNELFILFYFLILIIKNSLKSREEKRNACTSCLSSEDFLQDIHGFKKKCKKYLTGFKGFI